MWLIAGTVPYPDFPLFTDTVWQAPRVVGDTLLLSARHKLPVSRGTTALAATAILACEALKDDPPCMLLAGDCGTGLGSLSTYKWLAENIRDLVVNSDLKGLTFHYFYPDLDHHNKLFMKLEELPLKPTLVADAGFMYVAKMSGYAAEYDLFTPDMGELAFLADEKSPHPFYTRGFLLAEDKDVNKLLSRAMSHGNCPPNMIIKGKTDYIICDSDIYAQISEPSVTAMECIGGTGDIVTGFATAFLASGISICKSALYAARAARYLAQLCQPRPDTQVAELIKNIIPMFAKYKKQIMI